MATYNLFNPPPPQYSPGRSLKLRVSFTSICYRNGYSGSRFVPMAVSDDCATNVLIESRFIGTARAKISSLRFVQGRQINKRIVDRLTSVFQQERCRRYESENYIPVLLTKDNLKQVLKSSKLKKDALKRPSEDGTLHLLRAKKAQLLCLHGRHRIEAAKNFLPREDQWWTVRVYVGKSDGTHTTPFMPSHAANTGSRGVCNAHKPLA